MNFQTPRLLSSRNGADHLAKSADANIRFRPFDLIDDRVTWPAAVSFDCEDWC